MRPFLSVVIVLGVAAGMHANGPYSADVPAAGAPQIRWETSFTAACERARREEKPVLLLHLFGKLDEEFC